MQWVDLGLEPDRNGSLGAGRVGGRVLPGGGQTVPDPADGGDIAEVGWATVADVDSAVRAAAAAQPDWWATDPRSRAAALRQLADLLRERAEPLGDLVCAETGKRREEAVAEVHFSARYLDWFADATTRIESDHYETPSRRFLVDRRPVGVVAAISPWNFPLSIPVRKLAAALAAGCGVVQKPSELAPLSSLALTAAAEQVLPKGLVSVLVGDGAELTPALLDHKAVRAVSFTGSTRIGRLVAERAAISFTRTVLELGGRAPFVVCEDADPAVAVEALMVAKLRNNGESCLAANNVFVHAERYDEVVGALRERLDALVIGDPRDPGTGLGPLVRPDEVTRAASLAEASARGGDRVTTYGKVPTNGWFAPVALVESEHDGPAWTTEVFSPVLSIRRFTDEAALVSTVNGWRTRLGGYLISGDPEHQLSLARSLDVGIVGINNGAPNTPEVPFGGRDESGHGTEGGMSGMLAFMDEQTLSFAR